MQHEKPPIGVEPTRFAMERQAAKLCEAMLRYMDGSLTANRLMSVARWAKELAILLTAIEQLNDAENHG